MQCSNDFLADAERNTAAWQPLNGKEQFQSAVYGAVQRNHQQHAIQDTAGFLADMVYKQAAAYKSNQQHDGVKDLGVSNSDSITLLTPASRSPLLLVYPFADSR
ncbi:hypothetical protein FACS1894184_10610 [Clostridia bacterium]|nr:hypothetical protein FACS1894184_10610 [Clostridia bacterium]